MAIGQSSKGKGVIERTGGVSRTGLARQKTIMRRAEDQDKFANLGRPNRIWAVSSIHGERAALTGLHKQLVQAFQPGDRLVYLGNYLGHGLEIQATLAELLNVRRALLARPGMEPWDIVYLRGAQEEIWQKLLQLQFAPDPSESLQWGLEQGVGATLQAYGGTAEQGLAAIQEGPLALARWTNSLRAAMLAKPGHNALMSALRHAALCPERQMLFVHAGLDPSLPLAEQGEILWWGGGFASIKQPYQGYQHIVRGFEQTHSGVHRTDFTTSLDAGCGFGGPLIAACFDENREIIQLLEQ